MSDRSTMLNLAAARRYGRRLRQWTITGHMEAQAFQIRHQLILQAQRAAMRRWRRFLQHHARKTHGRRRLLRPLR